MTPAHRRYILVETMISVIINTVISIGFVFLACGGQDRVAVAALIPDAIPQSFMIGLMSTVVATLLTRRRVRAGAIAAMSRTFPRLLGSLPVRALVAALAATLAGLATHFVVLTTLAPDGLSLGATFAFKAIFGAILAAIVTPPMLIMALSDQDSSHGPPSPPRVEL
jgi:hypothetical protein